MQSGDCLPGFTNQCGESSPDRHAGNEFPQLPQPVRRVSRTVQTNAASFPNCPNQCGESSRIVPTSAASNTPTAAQGTSSHSFPNQYGEFPELSKPMRRVVPRPPSNAASFSGFPELSNQCGELFPESHAVRRTVLRTKTAQHSPSVMRVSKYNGLRAHTHASTRRLCRPCLCFFYNFFINIILFYYWVTNRDFIDLFCHTPKT